MKTAKTPSQVSDSQLRAAFGEMKILDHDSPSNRFSTIKILKVLLSKYGIRMTHRSFLAAVERIYPSRTVATRRGRHTSGSWIVTKTENMPTPADIELDAVVRRLHDRKETLAAEIAARQLTVRRIDRQIRVIKSSMQVIST